MKKFSKELKNYIENNIVEKKYIIFYTNIQNEEFFAEPLGSKNRKAKNVNLISIFSDKKVLLNFFNTYSMLKFNKDIESITDNQLLNFLIVEILFKDFLINSNLNEILDKQNKKYIDKNDLVKDFINSLSNIQKHFYNFKDINEDFINLCNLYMEENYKTIDTYLQEKNFTLNFNEKLCYIVGNLIQEFSKSCMMATSLCDKKIDYYISELNNEEFIMLTNLNLVDFTSSLNEESYKNDYPVYKDWCKMEINFYNKIKDKMIPLFDFIEQNNNFDKQDEHNSQMELCESIFE